MEGVGVPALNYLCKDDSSLFSRLLNGLEPTSPRNILYESDADL